MSQKWIYLTLISLVILFIALLFVEKEEELIIVTSDTIFSIYHSNDYESFNIEIMTNSKENYYFNTEYIANARILNDTEEVSITIKDITKNNDYVNFLETELYKVSLNAEIDFITDNIYILIPDAFLEIDYLNGDKLKVSIGEFNYLFQANTVDMSLNNLSATHELVDGVNTVGGINLELGNRSNNNINITSIDILSLGVKTNLYYLLQREDCSINNSVTICLGLDYYDFHTYHHENINLLLGKNNHINIYIPVVYTSSSSFIHRFAIQVTYSLNGITKTFIIDDFPYIRTDIFNDQVKDDFHVYRFND